MDPVTHTLTGAGLAAGRLAGRSPLAGLTLVLAANAPDVDLLVYARGPYAALAFRRGWTHGPVGLLAMACLVTALVLAFDRRVRRPRGLEPARAGPVLGLALLGAATHPVLDWLNNYGVRWLMPLDRSWYYGDAVFIVDPWIWLVLGGALFLGHSRRVGSLAGWLAAGAAATALMLWAPPLPTAARGVWLAGVLVALAVRVAALRRPPPPPEVEARRRVRLARGAVALACAYVAVMAAGSRLASRQVAAALEARGIEAVERPMVAPDPASPFTGSVVAPSTSGYVRGRFSWLDRPRVELDLERVTPLLGFELAGPVGAGRAADAARAVEAARVAEAARATPETARFLEWSRFPYAEVREVGEGWEVRIGDARYDARPETGSLSGLVVRLDAGLNPADPGAGGAPP